MARMHSRKKGKSGSKKPPAGKKLTWLTYDKEEVEQLVLKLAKAGKTAAQIGITLRDTYGIPDVKKITSKKITKILAENKMAPKLPEELTALIKKETLLLKHLEKNKKDMPAKRGLQLTESKIQRLTKHYKKKGTLPKDWVYSKEQAKLIVG